MRLASLSVMKLITKLVAIAAGAAGVVGSGILVQRWRRNRLLAQSQGDVLEDLGGDVTVVVIHDAEILGIADVDPQPMTQVAGEGIDPDVPVPPSTRPQ